MAAATTTEIVERLRVETKRLGVNIVTDHTKTLVAITPATADQLRARLTELRDTTDAGEAATRVLNYVGTGQQLRLERPQAGLLAEALSTIGR